MPCVTVMLPSRSQGVADDDNPSPTWVLVPSAEDRRFQAAGVVDLQHRDVGTGVACDECHGAAGYRCRPRQRCPRTCQDEALVRIVPSSSITMPVPAASPFLRKSLP